MRKGKRAQAAAKSGKGSGQETEKDKEIAALKAQLEEKQFELDVSNATLDVVLKKYEGASEALQKAETKTAIARALKGKCKLPRLRKKLKAAKEHVLLPRGRGKACQEEGKGEGAAIPRSRHFYVQQ